MSDDLGIHEEQHRRRCAWARCHADKWEISAHCLKHFVIKGLMKFRIIRPMSGKGSPKGAVWVANWMMLRDDYVAFFSERGKGIVAKTIVPCSQPLEAVAIALSIHQRERKHSIKITLDHFLSFVEFVWRFDHYVQRHFVEGRPYSIVVGKKGRRRLLRLSIKRPFNDTVEDRERLIR